MARLTQLSSLRIFALWSVACESLSVTHPRKANLTLEPADAQQFQKPRMLIMLGCSGSSILMDIARGLLQAHGIATSTPGGGPSGELIKTRGNPFFTEDLEGGMGSAMKLANEFAVANNQTLVFKEQGAQSKEFRDAAPVLQSLGVHVVHGVRENVLDRLVCQVKDCVVGASVGIPVDANGQESHLCFRRRGDKAAGETYKAKLSINGLSENLHKFIQAPIDEKARIEQAGFQNYESLRAEDLLDFEHDVGAFDRALDAWRRFMIAWGVDSDRKIVKKYLKQYKGSYAAELQSKTIFNFDEVKEVLNADPELAKLLRS